MATRQPSNADRVVQQTPAKDGGPSLNSSTASVRGVREEVVDAKINIACSQKRAQHNQSQQAAKRRKPTVEVRESRSPDEEEESDYEGFEDQGESDYEERQYWNDRRFYRGLSDNQRRQHRALSVSESTLKRTIKHPRNYDGKNHAGEWTIQAQSSASAYYKMRVDRKDFIRSCTCPDYESRKLPCKHMYMLRQYSQDALRIHSYDSYIPGRTFVQMPEAATDIEQTNDTTNNIDNSHLPNIDRSNTSNATENHQPPNETSSVDQNHDKQVQHQESNKHESWTQMDRMLYDISTARTHQLLNDTESLFKGTNPQQFISVITKGFQETIKEYCARSNIIVQTTVSTSSHAPAP
ncbi:hypothetical protein A0J61_09485, partial [Choanephora cucurbitarum]